MKRKIVRINEEKCTGCGLCASACHEGAIEMKDGKAHLIKEDYCDGLGDCLPHCPSDAISIVWGEVNPYDAQAVEERKRENCSTSSCPGVPSQELSAMKSELMQWPCQIKLVPVSAPFFKNAHLLIAADCTAYTYASFHHDFMRKRITLIGCPKLDAIDYTEKLTDILMYNDIKSITLVRMEVPCCGGLEQALKNALLASGKDIPMSVRIISLDGEVTECY